MSTPIVARRYAFESMQFDAPSHELCLDGRTIKLRPQASVALALLLSRQGDVVTKEELRAELWPDSRVVLFEGSIAAVIRELRRALGDNPKTPRFIETIPKRGYRFISQHFDDPDVEPHADGNNGTRAIAERVVRAVQGLALAAVVLLPGSEQAIPLQASAPLEPVTVAVLPFEDLTRIPGNDLLSQALPRDLVGWLGPALPGTLRVIDAPNSGSRHRQAYDFVIRGTIREDAEAVVVSARLLTDVDGGFVWGEDYRRNPADVSLISREVAAIISERVLQAAIPGRQADPEATPSNDAAAAAYRLGMEGLALLSVEGAAGAVTAFERATLLAPGFADGHARLAEALIRWPGPPVTPDRVERARQAAERSIELDPDNAVAHRVLGEIHLFFDRDWQLAGNRLERSVELSPADASGHHSYAGWLSARGRHGEALREIDLAEALDPTSVAISIDAMLMHFYARDFEGTVRAALALEQLWPESGSSHRVIVLSRLITGDVAGAAAHARSILAESAPTATDREPVTTLADTGALDAYWRGTLRVISRYVREDSGDPTALAPAYVQMGELDAAVDALELAMSEPRFSYFLPYLGVNPALDELCGHPRFERLLRSLGQSALSSEHLPTRCESTIRAAARRADSD